MHIMVKIENWKHYDCRNIIIITNINESKKKKTYEDILTYEVFLSLS